MKNPSAKSNAESAQARVSLILPGWADEASAIPHPAPLLESVENAFARLVGYPAVDLASIPGALCRWDGSGTTSTAPDKLVCADPVYLLAGSDDAQLVPGQRLSINPDENIALLAELNQVLGDRHGSFLHDSAGNWYYQGLGADALNASPTSAVEGHPMTAAMPRSAAAKPWRSLWSEVQMVLHQSPVNDARQARGEAPINSVWFWGGGALPAAAIESFDTQVFTDDPFAHGFAAAVGIGCTSLSAFDTVVFDKSSSGHYVVLDTQLLQDNPDFVDQLELGKRWGERLTALSPIDAQMDGLTGCREVFVPVEVPIKSTSVLSRLTQLFRR